MPGLPAAGRIAVLLGPGITVEKLFPAGIVDRDIPAIAGSQFNCFALASKALTVT